tara:strand:- start:1538 stop:1801 length:264 start_codon:yes stop_codon:yes gene_type:complete
MSLTKQSHYDKIESVKINDYYMIQLRKRISIMEDKKEISFSFEREVLNPDHDVDSISDATVKAQFKAVMTAKVKKAYETYKSNLGKL